MRRAMGTAERAVRLAGAASGAVPGANLKGKVMVANGCGHLILHLRQVGILVHLGNVDAHGARLAMPAVDAVAEIGVLRRASKMDA